MSSRDSETSAWARRGRRSEADRLAYAESARIDADTARREAELDRLGAETARKRADTLRVVAETTAMRLAAERDEALERAAQLEAELGAARGRADSPEVAEPDLGDTEDPEPALDPGDDPVPVPSQEPPAIPAPESIRFAARGHQPALTILLGLASLATAAAAVYLAYRDQLTSGPGLLAATATVVLAAGVGRMGRNATTVTIERGIVQVESARLTERADLTSTSTLVELVGQPGKRGRKVMLVRKTRGPLTVDDSMVDLDAFVEALRHWRPSL